MNPIVVIDDGRNTVCVWVCRECEREMSWIFDNRSVFSKVLSGEVPLYKLNPTHNDAYRMKECMIRGECPSCVFGHPKNSPPTIPMKDVNAAIAYGQKMRSHDREMLRLEECPDEEL